MTVLIFSALLLLIILLIIYFVNSKRNIGLNILIGFGILVGLLALGLNSLFDDSFGASTPVNVQAENKTDKNLKIYTITFWDNNWNGSGNYVTYDKKLKPNEKSDFWFENDGTNEFWFVAKNDNNEIEYLKIITESKSKFDFKIVEDNNIDANKVQLAQSLTFKKDKRAETERYVIWTNIILIGLLVGSLLVRKNWWQHQ